MKKTIGLLIVLVSIALAAVAVLRIWGIEIISLGNLVRSATTLAILGGLLVFLLICRGFFFRSNPKDYDEKMGNRAHPKRNF